MGACPATANGSITVCSMRQQQPTWHSLVRLLVCQE